MDSLTARLMSRSGLNRADPTVPPTQNVRMVTLKEKYGPAEQALHDARAALEALRYAQKNSPGTVNRVKWELYEAMEELQGREADFFASRYFGSGNKEILKGWKVDWKKRKFENRINDLFNEATNQVTAVANLRLMEARDAADLSLRVARSLKTMSILSTSQNRQNLDTNFKFITDSLKQISSYVAGNPRADAASLRSLKTSLSNARICERLAQLVMKNRWDLPYDLR